MEVTILKLFNDKVDCVEVSLDIYPLLLITGSMYYRSHGLQNVGMQCMTPENNVSLVNLYHLISSIKHFFFAFTKMILYVELARILKNDKASGFITRIMCSPRFIQKRSLAQHFVSTAIFEQHNLGDPQGVNYSNQPSK